MNVKNYRDQIKIVFFDIDDTLYLKKQDYIPDTVHSALAKLKANGIIPAIATGRTPCAFPRAINQLIEQENIEVVIAINGQYNRYQNEIVKKYPLNPIDIARNIQFFEANGIEYAFIGSDQLFVSSISERLKQALDPITTNYSLIPDSNYFKQNDIFQLLAFYDADQEELVNRANIFNNLKAVRWHEYSVDIFDEKGSKARGIQAVLAHLNLDISQAMAFGDGLNDIEMLSAVEVGVAMGNGHQQLKEVANYVTDSVQENGIANFLYKAGLID